MTIYVISHGDHDGRFAGYCAWRHFRDQGKLDAVKFLEVQYGQPFPIAIEDLTKSDRIYVLDFSYDREIMDRVDAKVEKLLVLDHHETARDKLDGASYAKFDMAKSGALMAWEYFFPEIKPPLPCLFVNDYDLWEWKYKGHTASFEAWLRYDNVGQNWKKWERLCFDCEYLDEALMKGNIVVEINEGIIHRFINGEGNIMLNSFYSDEHGRKIEYAVYNGLTILHSELATAVYTKFDIDMTVGWRVKGKDVVFSARSPNAEKFSVKSFAESHGGGGHPASAGFALPLDKGIALIKHLMSKT